MRQVFQPTTVCRQMVQIFEIVGRSQTFEGQIGQRSGRFSQGESWVSVALEESDPQTTSIQDPCRDAAGESCAENGDVVMASRWHGLQASQRRVRLMSRKRRMRAGASAR